MWLRNKYIVLIKKNILLIEKNNIIYNNIILIKIINLLYHFNFKHLLKYYDYNIIYEMDNLIVYDENITSTNIYKIILNAELIDNENIININDQIKKYSLNIPFFLLICIEKYNINCEIKFYILDGTRTYKIIDILNKKLCDLI